MKPSRKLRILAALLLVLSLTFLLAACGNDSGPGDVENLEEPQTSDEIEETIEESGLEGQTALAGQEAQEGETTEEQIQSNQAVYQLGSQEGLAPITWLLERDVETLNEEDLGEVKDLLIDRGSGAVLYALLAHGGLLNIGVTELPVPLDALQLREQAELMLPLVDNAAWETYPALGADWETNLTQEQADAINAFWSTPNDNIQPVEVQPIQAPEPGQALRTRTLLGLPVTAADGTAVGQVQNLLVAPSAHRLKYMVVALTGPSPDQGGQGQRAVLVPYAVFEVGDQQAALKAEFDMGLLENAPQVDGAALAGVDILKAGWDDEVEAYWSSAGF